MPAFLLALVGPLAIRVLAALGLGVVTLVGMDAAVNTIFNIISTQFSGLSGDVAGLLYLSGVPSGMAMILSALFARIAIVQGSKIARLA